MGAALPLFVAIISPANLVIAVVIACSLVFLGVLGGVAARVGGASTLAGAIRVIFWGALAMGLTAGVGALFGVAV